MADIIKVGRWNEVQRHNYVIPGYEFFYECSECGKVLEEDDEKPEICPVCKTRMIIDKKAHKKAIFSL